MIDLAGDDGFDELFKIPAGVHEVGGEPVEEFWVDGHFGLDPQVFGRFDESDAEEFLPDAVDGDAGGEGMIAGDKPLGEVEAVEGGVGFQGREYAGSGCFDDFPSGFIGTDGEDVGFASFFLVGHDHDAGSGLLDLADFIAERLDLCDELLVEGLCFEISCGKFLFLFRIPLIGRDGEKLVDPGIPGSQRRGSR